MSRKPEASTQNDMRKPPQPLELMRLLESDDLDAAIEAGLVDYVPDPAHDRLDPAHPALSTELSIVRQKLLDAWAARDRYRARQQRLARQTAEREARRAPAAIQSGKPSLPPAAADILARAKAKAAERSTK